MLGGGPLHIEHGGVCDTGRHVRPLRSDLSVTRSFLPGALRLLGLGDTAAARGVRRDHSERRPVTGKDSLSSSRPLVLPRRSVAEDAVRPVQLSASSPGPSPTSRRQVRSPQHPDPRPELSQSRPPCRAPSRLTFLSVPAFGLSDTSQAHQVHVSALSSRVTRTRIRPVGRCHRWRKQSSRIDFLSSFDEPAFACWTLLFPPGSSPSLRLDYPPPVVAGTLTGFPCSAWSRNDRVGYLLYAEAEVSTRPTQDPRPPLAASQRPALSAGPATHLRRCV